MCNCSQNPCSCANANCACPPDYTIQPATLSCQGTPCDETMTTECIFSTKDLTCVNASGGTDIQTILSLMDTKICQCASCTQGNTYFYVDASNLVVGDGTVGNPFQTLDEAYDAVIGSGSVDSPEFEHSTIRVAKGSYTTDLNIYIESIAWKFEIGTSVNYTGSDYFIDSSVISTQGKPFYVIGDLQFATSTGGFIHSSGLALSSNPNKNIFVECFSVVSTTPGIIRPVILCDPTASPNNNTIPVVLVIKLRSQQSSILSSYQTVIDFKGTYLFIDLQGGTLGYNGGTSGTILKYRVTDVNPQVKFRLENGFVYAYDVATTAMMELEGTFNYFVLDNIKTVNPGISLTKPENFIYITSTFQMKSLLSSNIFTFLLKDVYLTRDCFSTTTVIEVATPAPFRHLQMQNCIFYYGCEVSPYVLAYLGAAASNTAFSTHNVGCYNVIDGKVCISQLPLSAPAAGLGYLWNDSGVIKIA